MRVARSIDCSVAYTRKTLHACQDVRFVFHLRLLCLQRLYVPYGASSLVCSVVQLAGLSSQTLLLWFYFHGASLLLFMYMSFSSSVFCMALSNQVGQAAESYGEYCFRQTKPGYAVVVDGDIRWRCYALQVPPSPWAGCGCFRLAAVDYQWGMCHVCLHIG